VKTFLPRARKKERHWFTFVISTGGELAPRCDNSPRGNTNRMASGQSDVTYARTHVLHRLINGLNSLTCSMYGFGYLMISKLAPPIRSKRHERYSFVFFLDHRA
jgi:hypothetical protein